MNAFEMELKKILSQSKEAAHTTYVGRAAYIQVAPELRAKLEFVSLNIANQYNALKLTVLNRIDGAVDINILRFGDLLGKKMVSNPNFSDGVIPHLWDDYGKVSWYVYQPEQADYKLLAGVVDEYLDISEPGGSAGEYSSDVLTTKTPGSKQKQGPCSVTAPAPFGQESKIPTGTASPFSERGDTTRCLFWTFSLAD